MFHKDKVDESIDYEYVWKDRRRPQITHCISAAVRTVFQQNPVSQRKLTYFQTFHHNIKGYSINNLK
jgi:hypothetical protein